MHSNRVLWAIAIMIWSAVALTAATRAVSHTHSAVHSRNGDRPIAEEHTVVRAEASTLHIQAEFNGGLQIQGWDTDNYRVTLSKAADPDDNTDRWTADMLVKAPKSASLNLQVHNGSMTLYDVDGTVRARATNGLITVSGSSGNLDLSTQNGPVTLENNSGKLHVDAQNGPVTISLKDTAWSGSGIEVHANNGPLTLRIPSGYQSGVLIESDGHSPFACVTPAFAPKAAKLGTTIAKVSPSAQGQN
jgi:hypothetical protein